MLDLHLLEKVRAHGTRMLARCPACAEGGGDRRGDHLVIFPGGKYGCAAHAGDAEHRRRIHALAGIRGSAGGNYDASRTSAAAAALQRRETRRREAQARLERLRRQGREGVIRAERDAIIARFPWAPRELLADSPRCVADEAAACDPRPFLGALYQPGDLLWTGGVQQSGPRHAQRWRTCRDWQACADPRECGPYVSPAVWQPGTCTRKAEHIRSAPYLILDFDGIEGVKPEGAEALRANFRASAAIIRWLREAVGWQLAAIVHTGHKSLHAWFHQPAVDPAQLRELAFYLGIDAGLIGHPEHPARLPGALHQKSGRIARAMWLGSALPCPAAGPLL